MTQSASASVVNEALALIGFDGPPVTGAAPNFDQSTAGQQAQNLYPTAVEAVARMNNWDFARTFAPLALTGNTAPFSWLYEYGFPANCVQVWQVLPPSLSDPNERLPYVWQRGAVIVSNVMSPVIWTNVANALAFYNGNPIESAWDSLFRADVVRYLGSEFAVAILGKPDLAASLFEQVGAMTQIGGARGDT